MANSHCLLSDRGMEWVHEYGIQKNAPQYGSLNHSLSYRVLWKQGLRVIFRIRLIKRKRKYSPSAQSVSSATNRSDKQIFVRNASSCSNSKTTKKYGQTANRFTVCIQRHSLFSLFSINIIDIKLVCDTVVRNDFWQDPIFLGIFRLHPSGHTTSDWTDVVGLGWYSTTQRWRSVWNRQGDVYSKVWLLFSDLPWNVELKCKNEQAYNWELWKG